MKTLLALLLSVTFACKERQSQLLQESDDRETERNKSLVDVGAKIEKYINDSIEICRSPYRLGQKSKKTTKKMTQPERIVHCTFMRLGVMIDGTGYGPTDVAKLSQIEVWMLDALKAEKNEIIETPWKMSRYGRNKTGAVMTGRSPVWGHASKGGSEHSIVATVRIDKTLIGIDKLAHFFTTGYHFFSHPKLRKSKALRRMISRWLEGDHLTKSQIKTYRPIVAELTPAYKMLGFTKYGFLGSWSTGVISFADMEANEYGFQFYQDLLDDIDNYKFSFDRIDIKKLNEEHTPSKFVKGLKVDY